MCQIVDNILFNFAQGSIKFLTLTEPEIQDFCIMLSHGALYYLERTLTSQFTIGVHFRPLECIQYLTSESKFYSFVISNGYLINGTDL